MSKSTISTFQLFEMFPDQETARRLPGKPPLAERPALPGLWLGERITARKGGFYRCNQCKEDFTVRTGTIFERVACPAAQVGLRDVPARDGPQGHFVDATRQGDRRSRRSRHGSSAPAPRGVQGRSSRSCAASSKSTKPTSAAKRRTSTSTRSCMLGAARSARRPFSACASAAVARWRMPIAETDQATLHGAIHRDVESARRSTPTNSPAIAVSPACSSTTKRSTTALASIVRDGVTTNSIESVFAVLKRGLIGVYHHASPKHLGRYVDEFTFRLNEGNVKRHTLQRLDSFVDGVAGKRLTYKALIQ